MRFHHLHDKKFVIGTKTQLPKLEAMQKELKKSLKNIDALVLAFERGEIGILSDPVLIGELQAYEMERLPSGMLRYNAPEGMHDDCVMALALAYTGDAGPAVYEL